MLEQQGHEFIQTSYQPILPITRNTAFVMPDIIMKAKVHTEAHGTAISPNRT